MTFENFTSNHEQIEAHREAYYKVWNNGCGEALMEQHPELTIVDLLRLKELGFMLYLTDTHLEIQLRSAPPEMRAEFRRSFPDDQPTPSYIVRYLVQCIPSLP